MKRRCDNQDAIDGNFIDPMYLVILECDGAENCFDLRKLIGWFDDGNTTDPLCGLEIDENIIEEIQQRADELGIPRRKIQKDFSQRSFEIQRNNTNKSRISTRYQRRPDEQRMPSRQRQERERERSERRKQYEELDERVGEIRQERKQLVIQQAIEKQERREKRKLERKQIKKNAPKAKVEKILKKFDKETKRAEKEQQAIDDEIYTDFAEHLEHRINLLKEEFEERLDAERERLLEDRRREQERQAEERIVRRRESRNS